MEKSDEKKAGRPVTWYSQINAPEKAIQFYKMLAELVDDPAFEICHVFDGAKSGNTPVIKHRGKTVSIVNVIAPLLALDVGRKQCDTVGCCNPLHYLKASPDSFVSAEKDKEFVPQVDAPTGAEYAEIVEYEIDRRELPYDKPYQFADFRQHIHAQDLTDAQLVMALEYLNKQ